MIFNKRKPTHLPRFEARWRYPEAPKPHASLALSGEITYVEAPALREILFRMIRRDAPRHLVVELGALESIDTAGVAVLVEGLVASQASGQTLLFCEPSDRVRAMFELAGLHEALKSCCKGAQEVETRLAVEP